MDYLNIINFEKLSIRDLFNLIFDEKNNLELRFFSVTETAYLIELDDSCMDYVINYTLHFDKNEKCISQVCDLKVLIA